MREKCEEHSLAAKIVMKIATIISSPYDSAIMISQPWNFWSDCECDAQ